MSSMIFHSTWQCTMTMHVLWNGISISNMMQHERAKKCNICKSKMMQQERARECNKKGQENALRRSKGKRAIRKGKKWQEDAKRRSKMQQEHAIWRSKSMLFWSWSWGFLNNFFKLRYPQQLPPQTWPHDKWLSNKWLSNRRLSNRLLRTLLQQELQPPARRATCLERLSRLVVR